MASISINTNVLSIGMQNRLSQTTKELAASMERLSTGKKINSAADGAAQLSISTQLNAQISGNTIAQNNVQQGVLSLDQADASLQLINTNLTKIRDLAVEASNGIYSQEQRNALAAEAQEYVNQINTIAQTTTFNGLNILDGSITELKIQTGANAADRMDISNAFVNSSASALGITASAITNAFSSAANANAFITNIDSAIAQTSSHLASVGAYSHSLNSTLENLAVKQTNLESSNSLIMDVDYANEVSKYLHLEILQQTNASLLSQANIQPSLAYTLLQSI